METTVPRELKKVLDRNKVELEGVYECPDCHGHMMLDFTFLDQVSEIIHCPYCCMEFKVPE